jgi:hypothetical protein
LPSVASGVLVIAFSFIRGVGSDAARQQIPQVLSSAGLRLSRWNALVTHLNERSL